MHPAFSVLFFTTASGAGYGLLVWLGVLNAFDLLPTGRWFGFTGLALALGLITAGLLSSTFHLGHPERAWRALSQWRSSWLSREGILAVATYLPAGIFGIGWVFFDNSGGFFAFCGLLAAACALVTVYCTAMIYATLKTVRQWCNPRVSPLYLGFALAVGALWCQALLLLFGMPLTWFSALTGLLLLGLWILKQDYWRVIDEGTGASSIGSATGLGHLGQVRPLDPPHTEENFLIKEMGYRVARKHALKLRRLAGSLIGGLPLALTLLMIMSGGSLAVIFALLAALSASIGSFLERWLFFAEATHKVTLYYGAEAA